MNIEVEAGREAIMDYEAIATFLEVYRHKGITQAAEAMYVAQSTVSQRIKRLEQAAGGELFVRRPGMKGIGLTPRGEMLLPLAREMESLSYALSNLSERDPGVSLSVGAITSIHDAILPELFFLLSERHPEIRLAGLARQSVELYNMVRDRFIDIAFVSFEMRSGDVICRPAFKESYYLITSNDLLSDDGPKNPADLDPSQELFYSFSAAFREWHERIMPEGTFPRLKTDTLAMYCQMASKIPFWSVCPASWINCLLSMGVRVDFFDLTVPPPPRVTYLIKRRGEPHASAAAEEMFEAAMSELSRMDRGYPFCECSMPGGTGEMCLPKGE